jgi:hypothetical protein
MNRICLAASILVCLLSSSPAADPPKVTVGNLRRVFHNNEHNAFTDLVRFRDHLYLTFRSCPDGHPVSSTASAIVIRSKDEGATWEQVHRFSVPQRDTRDPHFLVFKDRLLVYTGTWWSGDGVLPREQYDMNLHLGYAVTSDDGVKWSEPIMLEGTFGHYIWRAASHGEKAFLCGRRKTNFKAGEKGEGGGVQSLMLESDDGLIWKKRGYFTEAGGNETAFLFEKDGSVLAIDRHRQHSLLIRSKPPYTEWSRQPLERFIGGPLLVKWGENYLVGGRHSTPDRGPKTTLYWLVGDKLQEFTEFPSGGDNSYPGFVELSPTRALISYYSTHEKHEDGKPFTAIYLAELTIE